MFVKILDYTDYPKMVDVGNLDDIVRMYIKVISGDEVLHVTYKDGTHKTYDSCDIGRLMDFHDDAYTIYDVDDPTKNLLNDEKFLNRKDSYWRDLPDRSVLIP